jgi:hypothetical protein
VARYRGHGNVESASNWSCHASAHGHAHDRDDDD